MNPDAAQEKQKQKRDDAGDTTQYINLATTVAREDDVMWRRRRTQLE